MCFYSIHLRHAWCIAPVWSTLVRFPSGVLQLETSLVYLTLISCAHNQMEKVRKASEAASYSVIPLPPSAPRNIRAGVHVWCVTCSHWVCLTSHATGERPWDMLSWWRMELKIIWLRTSRGDKRTTKQDFIECRGTLGQPRDIRTFLSCTATLLERLVLVSSCIESRLGWLVGRQESLLWA